jgi:hypothetical protein
MRAALKERRTAARQKSFLQGRIFFNNRRTSVDCLVRDISEHGAKLKFAAAVTTPDIVELQIPAKDEVYRAHVQWRFDNEVGVTFGVGEGEQAPGLAPAELFGRVMKLESEVATLRRALGELRSEMRKFRSDAD